MSEHISSQINLSSAWLPTSLVIFTLGLIPGMPNSLFITFAIITAILGFFARKKEEGAVQDTDTIDEDVDEKDENTFDVSSVKDDAKISLNIGFGLVSLYRADENSLVPSVTKLRKDISKRLGFVVPGIKFAMISN